MIYGAPQILRLAVDLHEVFVGVPLRVRLRTKLLNVFSSRLGGEHRTKSAPPEPHRFVAYIDAMFLQYILDIAK